jgi:hypothetical protein
MQHIWPWWLKFVPVFGYNEIIVPNLNSRLDMRNFRCVKYRVSAFRLTAIKLLTCGLTKNIVQHKIQYHYMWSSYPELLCGDHLLRFRLILAFVGDSVTQDFQMWRCRSCCRYRRILKLIHHPTSEMEI